MRLVLLLKESSVEHNDDYSSLLCSAGFQTRSVAVLQHALVNQLELGQKLQADYAGIIVTSQRAVEALRTAQEAREAAQLEVSRLPSCFAVGPATASALAALPQPPCQILGQDSGTGEALGQFLVDHFRERPERPLLYLTGDKRRTSITDALSQHNIIHEEIVVYETSVRSQAHEEVRLILEEHEGATETWVAFFSPSGVKAALPVVDAAARPIRLACIGPTTRDFLRDACSRQPDAVAGTPSAQGLLDAIKRCAG